MRRLAAWLTPEKSAVLILFAVIATLACLSPAHNDTWWHLRSGQEMARTRQMMFDDRFTFTVRGQFFWNPAWLAQLLFYFLYEVGGLPLLTLCCASVIVAAWAIVWRLTDGPLAERVVLLAVALSSATMTWSLRPQVFSLVLSMLVLRLVSEDRWRWLPVVFALWANLHAGFAMGIVIVVAAVAAQLATNRDGLWTRLLWAAACWLATLLTPLGFENWRQIVASIGRSYANGIHEWQPTPWPPQHLAFWGIAVLMAVLTVRRWKSVVRPADRVLIVAAILAFPLAARSLRNVPAFMMIAVPAISRLLYTASARGGGPSGPQLSTVAITRLAVVAAALVAGTAVVATAWRQPWPRLGWQPLDAREAEAIASCTGPLYNTYESGGPIIWFVPSQPVFIDSRQDPFAISFVQAATAVEATGDYETLFSQWRINCAALPPGSPTAARLGADGWLMRFSDPRWTVLERRPAATIPATPSPAP